MDLTNILAELRKERDAIDAAISALERLRQGVGRRDAGLPPTQVAKGATNGANHGHSLPDRPSGEE
jgi:hypothetical protein